MIILTAITFSISWASIGYLYYQNSILKEKHKEMKKSLEYHKNTNRIRIKYFGK